MDRARVGPVSLDLRPVASASCAVGGRRLVPENLLVPRTSVSPFVYDRGMRPFGRESMMTRILAMVVLAGLLAGR